jgi:vacuolar-type H+-ATPase subunit H
MSPRRTIAGYRRTPGCGRTEATPIDIIFLIEQLERVIASGRNMPLTNNVIIDQARALDLLDQLRVAVPEEVRAAKRVNEETERIVERAQEEAERILARAQEQAAFLIEERELTKAADIRSAEIIADGQREADEIRRGADEYAQSVLVRLEGECIRALQSIKHGLALLDERHGDGPAGSDDRRADERRDERNGGGATAATPRVEAGRA